MQRAGGYKEQNRLQQAAATALTVLAAPRIPGTARLLGFRFMEQGSLRLYLESEDASGVVAADVQPGGALTALLATRPSLLGEEWQTSDGADDPHCRYAVDPTDW
ncbi:hypothetical protein [Streptomyces sp. NPDC088182]|uniref:hypothetical protein n=1 Tax=Streptomyces sp. NPDC088182 TaxID=3365838 RepID=UPI0037FB9515